MDDRIVWVAGIALIVGILAMNKTPELMQEVRGRYEDILETIREDPDLDPRWEPLRKRVILTGMCDWNKRRGAIAYNVNKGYEIYLCLDGADDPNETRINTLVHVLIHELAHSTVREYEHSDKFWQNFMDLRKYCTSKGLFDPSDLGPFCGENIRPRPLK
jgi:hypothetical protein